MEGSVDLGNRLHTEVVCPPTRPRTNPAVHGRELNSQPVDHESDALTTTPPRQLLEFFMQIIGGLVAG